MSLGMGISAVVSRQVTAASLVVVIWFLLVFFYDLGLLALLVMTKGAASQELVSSLVVANPAGLYRVQMMEQLAGPEVLESLGMTAELPGTWVRSSIWAGWILGPLCLSSALLSMRKVVG